MTVKEATKALGVTLGKDPDILAFNEAKRAYDSNGELQNLLIEYGAERTLLGELYAKPFADAEAEAAAEKVNARVSELAEAITTHEAYVALAAAQEKVNALMQQVNADISFYAFGEIPGCTHDCSSCGGCSH